MVRTNTLAGPGASDAAVIRIKDPQTGEVKRGALALSTDGNGRWCHLNPRLGAMHAVAEAARNVACSGARPIAATNCLNFGSPEKPEVMWQFSEAIDGLTVACDELETPITGGNVSFYNETLGKSIYPTPVIGILGIIDDASQALKLGFREKGDLIVLLDGVGSTTIVIFGCELWHKNFLRPSIPRRSRKSSQANRPQVDLAAEKSPATNACRSGQRKPGAIRARHQRRRHSSHAGGVLALRPTRPQRKREPGRIRDLPPSTLSSTSAALAPSSPSSPLCLPAFSRVRDNMV